MSAPFALSHRKSRSYESLELLIVVSRSVNTRTPTFAFMNRSTGRNDLVERYSDANRYVFNALSS